MVSVRQIKAARALLAWSQGDLAAKSGVSEPTVARLESAEGPLGGRSATIAAICNAITDAGVSFVTRDGGATGVMFSPNPSAIQVRKH